MSITELALKYLTSSRWDQLKMVYCTPRQYAVDEKTVFLAFSDELPDDQVELLKEKLL